MIMGFGNNVVSSLAADITAGQTTIQVMPGTGAKFAGLLSADYANSSNTQKIYAKLTLTDAKETVFEICHLTSVSNDILTVVRAQEGTTPKGWSLNDVIANFATRGSENVFVQIEQLQSGHYTSAVAGGTENALTLELPATYFLNGSTDWTLRAPVIIYPAKTNTGPSTLQLTLGGRVLGAFSLHKANNVELNAGDLISGVPFCCVLDASKTFFTVINPATAGNVRSVNGKGPDGNGNVQISASDVGALTQSDGDARYVNIEGDIMLGDLSTPNLTAGTVTATNGTMAIRAVFDGTNQYSRLYFVSADGTIVLANLEADFGRNLVFNINGHRFVMDRNGNMFVPGAVYDDGERVYSPNNKPTASDVEALSLDGGTLAGPLFVKGQASTAAGFNLYSGKDVIAGGGGVYEGGTRVYSPNYRPTAEAVGALPIGGGTLGGPLLVQGQISTDAGYNVYASQDVIAGNGGVYERGKRVYSPNNPPTSASLAANGWWQDNVTGMIKQWVNNIAIPAGNGVGVTVNLPKSFNTTGLSVSVSCIGGGAINMIGWANLTRNSVYITKGIGDPEPRTVSIEVIGY